MTARQRVTFGLKVAFAYGLYFSGVLRLWQRMVMRRKAVVLMYHRVLTADERPARRRTPRSSWIARRSRCTCRC